jgi:hypothetical protein
VKADDLARAIYLAMHCPGFMPTRDEWEEVQRLLITMANELQVLHSAAGAHPQGDKHQEEPSIDTMMST